MSNKKPEININAIRVYFKIKCFGCAYYHFYSVNNEAYFLYRYEINGTNYIVRYSDHL